MMNIPRKSNVRNELSWPTFGDGFDNFFEGFFRPMQPLSSPLKDFTPAVDVTESDAEFRVRADLPGVDKENIKVSMEDGLLTIEAETKKESEDKEEGRILRQERSYGKFVRTMNLGPAVDVEKTKAMYKDGVLELVLPKRSDARAKSIAIDVK